MNDQDYRPSPEEFLRAINAEEKHKGKGQLKIFLGMAAGVGKTFAMLSEAQYLKLEGIDVVIGIVESHGRHETENMMAYLDIVPEKKILYRGIEFKELDVDAIIKRNPKIVLVDELAHSNVPGSKHAKRWQDVLDILDAGIDVYTTLNVQHIESLNDVVRGITDISVRETIPDRVIEMAESIKLVDITPEDLLERLKEGKVYLGNQSIIAVEHFFQKNTLTALREVVMRYAAEKVDRDLRQMMPSVEKVVEWKPRDKFLVAVDSSTFSQKLIRIARRLAFNIDAPWIAAHVNDGTELSDKETQILEKNLLMARDLGAEVVTVNDPDIGSGIQRIARYRGITQMIVGAESPKVVLGLFKKFTTFDKLLKDCPGIDIHVIKKEDDFGEHKKKYFSFSFDTNITHYLQITVWVVILSIINYFILPFVGHKGIVNFFLLGILGLSLFFNKGPIFIASVLFAFIWAVFFVPPIGDASFNANEDIILLIFYLATGITSGILVDRAREHRDMLIQTQESTQALYDIARQIANTGSTEETLKFLQDRLSKIIEGSYDFVIKDLESGILMETKPLFADEKERTSALWAYENGKEAGWSTDTLPSANNLYLPLKAFHDTVGLLIYTPIGKKSLSLDEKSFLYTVCQQLAAHVERQFSLEKTRQTESLIKLDDIQKRIMEQFLEAFQYPIERAEGALSELKKITGQAQTEISTIETSCQMIVQLRNNIAAIIQISEGMLPLKTSINDLGSLIQSCCETLQIPSLEHILELKLGRNLPLVKYDEYLMEILICNLILHAVKYSPLDSVILVEAKRQGNEFLFSVLYHADNSPDLKNDGGKTGRFSGDDLARMGLELSISKAIAEIHDGELISEHIPNKGEKITLSLPLIPLK